MDTFCSSYFFHPHNSPARQVMFHFTVGIAKAERWQLAHGHSRQSARKRNLSLSCVYFVCGMYMKREPGIPDPAPTRLPGISLLGAAPPSPPGKGPLKACTCSGLAGRIQGNSWQPECIPALGWRLAAPAPLPGSPPAYINSSGGSPSSALFLACLEVQLGWGRQ